MENGQEDLSFSERCQRGSRRRGTRQHEGSPRGEPARVGHGEHTGRLGRQAGGLETGKRWPRTWRSKDGCGWNHDSAITNTRMALAQRREPRRAPLRCRSRPRHCPLACAPTPTGPLSLTQVSPCLSLLVHRCAVSRSTSPSQLPVSRPSCAISSAAYADSPGEPNVGVSPARFCQPKVLSLSKPRSDDAHIAL